MFHHEIGSTVTKNTVTLMAKDISRKYHSVMIFKYYDEQIMIVGLLLRNFKTYQGINYIPLTDEDNFCGLVGDNGIGKSSVLESLDCLFNEKTWNYNNTTKKAGLQRTSPFIVPVFLLKKTFITKDNQPLAVKLDHIARNISEHDVNSALKQHIKKFIECREKLTQRISLDEYFLLPIGIDYSGELSISIFNCKMATEKLSEDREQDIENSEQALNILKPLLCEIKSKIDYLYIPKEINPEVFTKLESDAIQVLMGEKLTERLATVISASDIKRINAELTKFIDEVSTSLDVYSYRTPTDRQQHLKKIDIYNLIIESYFKIRKLHSKLDDSWLEISMLSSGEKQKAIIDVAYSLLCNHRADCERLIIAVDEPESSLHMSACFEQFDALYQISKKCMQVLFTSHWYGFLPTIEKGSATIILRKDVGHVFDQMNLSSYREQVKQLRTESKGKLPYDIRLKSINDFIQSIIASALSDDPHHWIICEGTSEKIYLSKYLKDALKETKVRIIPVGGAKEIKRIYNHLAISYDDFKEELKSKIILISDTDAELIQYDVNTSYKNLICKRIVNCPVDRKTKLVHIHSNPVSPETEIEMALNGEVFLKALKTFKDEYPKLLEFIDKIETATPNCTYYSLDLRTSEWDCIKQFFDIDTDNNKYRFAKKYTELMTDDDIVPDWIKEIIAIIND